MFVRDECTSVRRPILLLSYSGIGLQLYSQARSEYGYCRPTPCHSRDVAPHFSSLVHLTSPRPSGRGLQSGAGVRRTSGRPPSCPPAMPTPGRAENETISVAHLSSLRGFSLDEIDKMLVRRPSNSAPPSPRHDDGLATAPAAAPAAAPTAAPAAAPATAAAGMAATDAAGAVAAGAEAAGAAVPLDELAAMRRALQKVEEEAARGVRLDPRRALDQELETAHSSSAQPTPPPRPAQSRQPQQTPPGPAQPAQPFAASPEAEPPTPAPLEPPLPAEEPLVIEPDDEPRRSLSRADRNRSRHRWFPRSFALQVRGAANRNPTEGSTSVDAEPDAEGLIPLAAFDGAAPEEGESDWAFALRWSQSGGAADAATVLAAIQAAHQNDPHCGPGASSDGQQQHQGSQHRRAASLTPSFGDATTLAAAARRAVSSARGKVAPEATAEAGGGGAQPAAPQQPAGQTVVPTRPPRRPLHRRSVSG